GGRVPCCRRATPPRGRACRNPAPNPCHHGGQRSPSPALRTRGGGSSPRSPDGRTL
ncbi:MAG: hypothetical protein AVDCRST_MAG15-43, partial [uncultured Rubellimicrobium sp.]